MAEANTGQKQFVPTFTKDQIDSLTKKYYGLSGKDLEEIYLFINGYIEVLSPLQGKEIDYDSAKPVIDKCNKIPAHCGAIVISYFTNNYGDDAFNSILLNFYLLYKQLHNSDPESVKTTDVYETVACFILFSPQKTLRKFITDNFEISKEIYAIMRKRPGTNAAMTARYAELFVTSKFDEKYSNLIYENYKVMLDFLSSKDWGIEGVSDPVSVNFGQLKNILEDFYERNKKESLKKVNKLINKKADIGEAFFYFIALTPSCAMEVIYRNSNFTGDFITSFLCQMKVQYVAELAVLIDNLPEDRLTFMNYLSSTYKLNNSDDCLDRLSNVVKKGGVSTYGALLRQVAFYPNIEIQENENFGKVAHQLSAKLSSVANNLTADISEKSMSMTIVPLGRSRIYQDLMDKIEGFDPNTASSFVAKMRDKDIIKKIRESWLSWFALDQESGHDMIAVLQAIEEIYQKKGDADKETLIKEIYKTIVLKYGIIMTLPYFKNLFEDLFDKQSSNDEGLEDYENIG